MNLRIFDKTKTASRRLKSPKVFKTEGNYQQQTRDNKSRYPHYQQMITKTRQTRSQMANLDWAREIIVRISHKLHKRVNKLITKGLIVNNYSQQTRQQQQQLNRTHTKYNTFLDSFLKLNKSKEMSRVPVRNRKQLWHNYVSKYLTQTQKVNPESLVPERRVQSQINILKTEETYNKNRSTSSLCGLEPQDTFHFNLKFSHKTRQGQIANNPSKVNQDIFYCQTNFIENLHLFFVCDGHGQNGHLVSNFIQTHLPNTIQKDKSQLQSHQIKETIQKCIQNVSVNVNKQPFDTNFSGSTLNGIILLENGRIHSFNVGDSRTVIGKLTGYGSKFKPYQLSIDHKLTIKKEQYRVISSGGKIDTFYDQNGPLRVWVNGTQYPGLAMSRSIGDQVAQSIGVSSIPDIVEYQLGLNDKFIIIASDGVWEFLDNQIVVDIVGKYYQQNNIEGASEELMRVAYRMWTIDDDSVVDDITFILIFIQNQ
ncbi:unnamed protein product (macronuclear) [Paramecium tetraurelia]|uniref:PPM-type phosphatase domain-containing protein n=1 Tax=Paramecium tetraurelia TaxID=5888 RepID=A0CGE4_PARTE|nr:uncharacterized protein GSPATT00007301001 [Paramecium tetraurelia]CAK69861.1 unnamed protein product [Paramecium tetraurelia]|eukprot:XP_001437258.1 hypothetical protein (macronuclear) [Paramecium tetraurelia strain d4-2]